MKHYFLSSAKMLFIAVALLVAQNTFAADPAPIPGAEEVGDKTRTPIIFVHGQNGAGDQFERQSMHFTSNGYPASWIIAFDYNTAVRSNRRGASQADGPFKSGTTDDLDALVDAVRSRTGFDKVNLVGHSRGTFESGAYLSDPARAAKIAHYATIGGADATNPNDVPSIGISGLGDIRPGPAASNGGKVGWMPAAQDHVMVCTSDESFWEVFAFFNGGEKPKVMKFVPEDRPQVGGYVKSYINNKALGGATVEVWSVEPDSGMRMSKKPLVTLTVDSDGTWGPFSAEHGQPYEFVVRGTAATIAPRFFRSPFTHSDRLVYFRIAANHDDYRASPFDNAPHLLTDKSPVFVVRHQNGSMVPGLMTLKLDGTDLLVPPIIVTTKEPRQSPTVAIYLADGNANGKSELTTIEGFGGAFVNSGDVYIKADPKESVEFKLNDEVINVPALPASEAGPISIIFENFE